MANPRDNTENRSKGAPGQEAGQEESWLQSSSARSISQPDPHQGLSESISSEQHSFDITRQAAELILPLHPPQSSDEAGEECRYCFRKGQGGTLYSETALIYHIRIQHPFPCLQGCVDLDFSTASHRQRHYNGPIHRSSIAKEDKCGRCGYTTDVRERHLRHLGKVQPCVAMVQPAMYECRYHGPTSLNKEEHLSHLEDDKASIKSFMCGRCGHTSKARHDHLQHLHRQRPCPQMKEPKMYECKTHGPTSLDMEEHITHLRDPSLHLWALDDE